MKMQQPPAVGFFLKRPATKRFFPDLSTVQKQHQSSQDTSSNAKRTSIRPPKPLLASNNRHSVSSGIPAPSHLRQPSSISTTTTVNKRPTASSTLSSGQPHQQQSTKATIPVASKSPSPIPEITTQKPLVRRDSYTISAGEASGQCPVINSGPSTPDDHRDIAPKSGINLNVLISTARLQGQASTTPQQHPFGESEFRHHLNRPVCIGGKKRGVLRYFGPLHMVDGLFCGIELDEPVGQHDGKVDGRRYFRAGYNRGIFAPMEKVELIGHERTVTPILPPPASAELIIPPDAEFLTDVEPHLLSQSFLGQSDVDDGNESFDLSESLMFLKGSRFRGMDISMTPSQLAAELKGGDDNDEHTLEDEDEQGVLQLGKFGADFYQLDDNGIMDDESTTPVLEQPSVDLGETFGNTNVDSVGGKCKNVETGNGILNTTMTFSPKAAPETALIVGRHTEEPQNIKERPISTVSADTGYQGDTEYETQSGRSVSPREVDISFERKQKVTQSFAVGSDETQAPQNSNSQQLLSQDMPMGDHDHEDNGDDALEFLSCETTLRDSRGRVIKVIKESRPIPKLHLQDLNDVDTFQSLSQLTDATVSTNSVPQSTTFNGAPSSPSKAKRTKSVSVGRESERKPAKSAKVSISKENSQRSEDIASRPSSAAAGSPVRKKTEKMSAPPSVEESTKKAIKAPAKPSKHSEIMAKLQQSMANDKQKPRKEVKSKFMTALAVGTPNKSGISQLDSVSSTSSRTSYLPKPHSRPASTTSSVLSIKDGQPSNCSSSLSTIINGNDASNCGYDAQDSQQSVVSFKAISPLDEKQTATSEHTPADVFKPPHSPQAKGINGGKQGAAAVTTQSKISSSSVAVPKKSASAVSKKTTGSGIGQTKDAPSRSAVSSSRTGNVASINANGSTTNVSRQQQNVQPKSTMKEHASQLRELETQAEQLKLAKERLVQSAKGFEALGILVRYYVEQVMPALHASHETTKREVATLKTRTDILTQANDDLQKEKQELVEAQTKALDSICREYDQKLAELEANIVSNYEQKLNEMTRRHRKELEKVQEESAADKSRLQEEFERQQKAETECFETKIASIRELYGRDMNDLKALHQKASDDLLRRFEEEKSSMTMKMDELHQLCDRYKREARQLEETLTKDNEKKASAISERLGTYQREIDSLRAVMDMKNQELHDLRTKCSLLEKELEDLPKCRTKIALLEQKNAELKETLDSKKQTEKQFYQQHSELLQSCERERERNQRLTMDKEQLEFKLNEIVMSRSAYETSTHRKPCDDSVTMAHRCRTAPRPAKDAAVLKDKPMSQSLIQIYAESSPWSPRATTRTGQHHDNKDLPVTVYMAAQDGDVAKVLQFDTDGECSKSNDFHNGDRKLTGQSSSDSTSSPQTPPRGAKSVDKMSSPKRRISPLRRRNFSISSGVAPMPATPEHPIDSVGTASDRMTSEPPPDCPKLSQPSVFYDGHDPQDPAPPTSGIECLNAGGKTGCIASASGWTDSGVFTTSCSSDTQDIMTFGNVMDTVMATSVISSSTAEAAENFTVPVSDTITAGASVVMNGSTKIPKKNSAA